MKNIRLLCYQHNSNFGDVLNFDLVRFLTGQTPMPAPATKADIVCIGSLLELLLHDRGAISLALRKKLRPPIAIFGTGFIAPENTRVFRNDGGPEGFYRDCDVLALRGTLSRSRVETITGRDLSDLALGDPGLLSRAIYKPELSTRKKYAVGIVPHYVDHDLAMVDKLAEYFDNSLVIDVLSPPKDVVSQISSCEVILSSAMHGLIVADSLGVPNIRMILSDKLVGGSYKFDDYYSAYGLTSHRSLLLIDDADPVVDLEMIRDDHPITQEMVEHVNAGLIKAASNITAPLH